MNKFENIRFVFDCIDSFTGPGSVNCDSPINSLNSLYSLRVH